MKKEKILTAGNFIFAVSLMLFFISFAVVLTLNFRPLYYRDIKELDIVSSSGLSEEVIRENYDALIDYNSILNQKELQFPTFTMSENGRIHFAEVKVVFGAFQYLLIISFLVCAGLLVLHIRKKSFVFLKLAGIVTLVLPTALGVLIAINWQYVFTAFHRIVFRNDYWIFDPAYDPVITILPDVFFMHCAIMILGVVILCALLCFVLSLLFTGKTGCRGLTSV